MNRSRKKNVWVVSWWSDSGECTEQHNHLSRTKWVAEHVADGVRKEEHTREVTVTRRRARKSDKEGYCSHCRA